MKKFVKAVFGISVFSFALFAILSTQVVLPKNGDKLALENAKALAQYTGWIVEPGTNCSYECIETSGLICVWCCEDHGECLIEDGQNQNPVGWTCD